VPLAKHLEMQTSGAAAALPPTWEPLPSARETWQQAVDTSLVALQSVEADMMTYFNAITGDLIYAAATPLPSALATVRSLIGEARDEVAGSCDYLLTAEQELQTKMAATSSQLATRITELEQEKATTDATRLKAADKIGQLEILETSLLSQRGVADARCEVVRLNTTDVDHQEGIDKRATAAMGRLGELS